MQKKNSKIVFPSCHFHCMIFHVVNFNEIIIQFGIHEDVQKYHFLMIRSNERIGLNLFSENILIFILILRVCAKINI